MIVKTKKYKLETSTYVKIGLLNILKEQWWVGLIALALCSGYFFVPSNWWFIGTGIALVLYILFWLIQLGGMSQVEQGKIFFERLSYEISSQQIMIKLSSKQGMPLMWDNVKKASKGKSYLLLTLSKVQFIYLPFKVFRTENERKFVETILKRKGYLKS